VSRQTKNAIAMKNYADMMAMRLWLKIGREIEMSGRTVRGVSSAAGTDHALVLRHVRDAREGHVPSDTRVVIIDRLCRALGRPWSFFLSD